MPHPPCHCAAESRAAPPPLPPPALADRADPAACCPAQDAPALLPTTAAVVRPLPESAPPPSPTHARPPPPPPLPPRARRPPSPTLGPPRSPSSPTHKRRRTDLPAATPSSASAPVSASASSSPSPTAAVAATTAASAITCNSSPAAPTLRPPSPASPGASLRHAVRAALAEETTHAAKETRLNEVFARFRARAISSVAQSNVAQHRHEQRQQQKDREQKQQENRRQEQQLQQEQQQQQQLQQQPQPQQQPKRQQPQQRQQPQRRPCSHDAAPRTTPLQQRKPPHALCQQPQPCVSHDAAQHACAHAHTHSHSQHRQPQPCCRHDVAQHACVHAAPMSVPAAPGVSATSAPPCPPKRECGGAELPLRPSTAPSQPTPASPAAPGVFPGKGASRGCAHYQRNCWIKAACCDKYYPCRRCHDAVETHEIDRHATQAVACVQCGDADQPVAKNCRSCGTLFARYFCAVCKFYDDREGHEAYHCPGCGICRVGKGLGIDNHHCYRCGNCLPIGVKDSHPCRERSLDANCPICKEYLATSTDGVVFMRCGHSIHVDCLRKHTDSRYTCPICNRCLTDMTKWYLELDKRVARDVLPPEYLRRKSRVLCHDCGAKTVAPFHFVYHKCGACLGYNTRVLEQFDEVGGPNDVRGSTPVVSSAARSTETTLQVPAEETT